jgi:hypothetical protein
MSWAIVAVTVISSVATAVTQKQAADASAKVASVNAKNEEVQAGVAAQQAQLEAEQQRRQNRLRLGAQRAAAAKNGIDLSSGSIEDVMQDTAVQGELDALSTIYAGQTQASYLRGRASVSRAEARNYKSAGTMSAVTTLIGGAGRAAGTYASRTK